MLKNLKTDAVYTLYVRANLNRPLVPRLIQIPIKTITIINSSGWIVEVKKMMHKIIQLFTTQKVDYD